MLFGKYLKICREHSHLTQEELVSKCYNYDKSFAGLDVGTLSRWERGVSKPSVDKQLKITKIFQSYSKTLLPYFDIYSFEDIQTQLSSINALNLIGNSKEHILNFPHSENLDKELKIININEAADKERLLKMPSDIFESLTNNYYEFSVDIFLSWAKNKNNLFVVSEYQGQFFGMLFAVSVKPEVFEDILLFKRDLKTLNEEDFTQGDEKGCSFPLTFFAYNQKSASLLYLHYYAYLITHQESILEVGMTVRLESVVKLVDKIELKKYHRDTTQERARTSYKSSLEDILLREDVFRMLFTK